MVNSSAKSRQGPRCFSWLSKQVGFAGRTLIITLSVLLSPLSLGGLKQIQADIATLSAEQYQGREFGHNQQVADWLSHRFQQVGLLPYQNHYRWWFEHGSRTGTNVLGYKPGLSDDFIVITAHFDHLGARGKRWYAGADDNASGVAVMLSMASAARGIDNQLGWLFVATDGEEQGLFGARALLRDTLNNGRPVLNINLDMVGRSVTGCRLHWFSNEYPDWLKRWSLQANSLDCHLKKQRRRVKQGATRIDWLRASDHFAFHQAGIPFVFLGGSTHGDYHRFTDTPDRLNPKLLDFAFQQSWQLLLIADRHFSTR